MRRLTGAAVAVLLGLIGLIVVPAAAQAAATPVTLGTPFTATLGRWDSVTPGAEFSFTGRAGTRIILRSADTGPADYSAGLSGPTFGTLSGYPEDGFLDLGTLGASGTWTLNLRNWGEATTQRLTLTAVTDLSGQLATGRATTLNFANAGQNAALTFSATAGQKLGFDVAAPAFSPATVVAFQLIRPDGSLYDFPRRVDAAGFWDRELDQAGTWTLQIDPEGRGTGSLTFTASIPVDQVKNVTPGTDTAVTYPGKGVNVRLRFTGAAGQRLTVGITASALVSNDGNEPRVSLRVIDPAGQERGQLIESPADSIGDGTGFREFTDLLDTAGTWTLLLDPRFLTTGTQTVRVGLVKDTTSTLTLGQATTLRIPAAGANPRFTFTGTAGQTVVASVDPSGLTGGSWGGPPIVGGPTPVSVDLGIENVGPLVGRGQTFGEQTLPADGTYTLVADGLWDTVGTLVVTLRPATTTTTPLRTATPTTTTITAGNKARFTFGGVVGRRPTLDLTSLPWPDNAEQYLSVRLVDPAGSEVFSSTVSRPTFLEAPPIGTTGTWTLELDPTGPSAGTFGFTPNLVADQKSTLTTGTAKTVRITTPGQQARHTFQATAGRRLTLDTAATTWTGPVTYTLYQPDGSMYGNFAAPVPYGTAGHAFAELDYPDGPIRETGTWTLVVDPVGPTTGSQAITLGQVADRTGTLTAGRPTTVDLSARGQQARYGFVWDGQGTLPWKITGSTIAQGRLVLVDPNTGQLYPVDFGTGSAQGEFETYDHEAGTWLLRIDPAGAATGKVTVTLK